MLRINHVGEPDQPALLRLEGKLLGPWVNELRVACRSQGFPATSLSLDLSAITFVDAAGAALLADLVRQGTRIIACSGYLEELLHVENR